MAASKFVYEALGAIGCDLICGPQGPYVYIYVFFIMTWHCDTWHGLICDTYHVWGCLWASQLTTRYPFSYIYT